MADAGVLMDGGEQRRIRSSGVTRRRCRVRKVLCSGCKGRVPEQVGEQAGDQVRPLPLKNSPLSDAASRLSLVIQSTTEATCSSASGELISIQSSTLMPDSVAVAGSSVTTVCPRLWRR